MVERLDDVLCLLRIADQRALTTEATVSALQGATSALQASTAALHASLGSIETLIAPLTTVPQTLSSHERRAKDAAFLLGIVEARTRTLEYEIQQIALANRYQIDFLQKFYVESIPPMLEVASPVFTKAAAIELLTDHSIASGSNDHLSPDSTMEGVSRPTFFVQNCIDVLGPEMACLDLGTGAAGIVFEFTMRGILALGVDGSDFCRRNRIGYWPLLTSSLFTCDITQPFTFRSKTTQSVAHFDLITMWEVLEHIGETGLPALFGNIAAHLTENGYFIGSISFVPYNDEQGHPYHVTLRPQEWWREKFRESGLVMLENHPFNEKWFPRGNGPRFQDFHNYARHPEDGYLFVARKANPRELMNAGEST